MENSYIYPLILWKGEILLIMREKQRNYIAPGSHNFPIPSISEFHTYASNLLTTADFSTDYPSGYAIDKTASAIGWTCANEKKRDFHIKNKLD